MYLIPGHLKISSLDLWTSKVRSVFLVSRYLNISNSTLQTCRNLVFLVPGHLQISIDFYQLAFVAIDFWVISADFDGALSKFAYVVADLLSSLA